MYTPAGRSWFPWFRLYGPENARFDKSWTMLDIVQVKGRANARLAVNGHGPKCPTSFRNASKRISPDVKLYRERGEKFIRTTFTAK
jgi:hypothetical protein